MSASMLLVMDMINDLVSESGAGAATYREAIVSRGVLEATASAISAARKAGVPVGFVRIGFSDDYRECPPDSPIFSKARETGMFRLAGDGARVHASLSPQPRDFDIVKHRVSPFYGTALEPVLRAQGISRLVLCGVSTNGVVHSGAREAHDRDYACVVLEDCCAAASAEEHDRALRCMQPYASVVSSSGFRF